MRVLNLVISANRGDNRFDRWVRERLDEVIHLMLMGRIRILGMRKLNGIETELLP
jgi:hypothetical protein